ncbi:MAG TPA: acetyl-CoA decarbonylase/synthase complex subunit gamma [Deltaproteobacteria bacterium]|nr:acetyl-CoA decarbonylase/synthase complex subunit gamma [Deltaproteobacteria bacterium]HOI07061.1 acetyl-CoA decarbonylase/synthase complex subunit gamma [Deltaproteobacteria bacterium]
MALTGLQIQKLLPGTNCKECKSNTCLAFAMKLAAKKADIKECPYASDEAKATLGLANEPPVKTLSFGRDRKLLAGGELVLYRHDKTFVNRTILAVAVRDTDPADGIDRTLQSVRDYVLERVGETLTVEMVAVVDCSGDAKAFADLASKAADVTGRPVILRSGSMEALKLAASAVKGTHSVVCAPSPEAAETLIDCVKEEGHALAVTGADLDAVIGTVARLRDQGFMDILLCFETHSVAEHLQTNTIVRRAAIRDGFKPLGFPTLHFIDTGSLMDDTTAAVTEITRYGGITVLPTFDPAQLATLLTLRLNIFTDPQKPIQVEPGVYPIGEPTPQSPVFVTTNFSLTFFIVSGEIENSGISAWLVVPECEGMSVLTAWAAGKFTAAGIAKFIKETGFEDRVDTRALVIPGYVAGISGELEDSLAGWKVMVGPEEAADLEGFIKQFITG